MGRPPKGALSTYTKELRGLIKSLRKANGGWGAISILVELEEGFGYAKGMLPNESSVHRYLQGEGLVPEKEPVGALPVGNCKRPGRALEQLEMDAEGAVYVEGLGHHSMINVKDGHSKKYCMALPVPVKNGSTQPSTPHYKWCLRLLFGESGLPARIQVDKDSVFIENSSRSPFPSRLHLWLAAPGVELCFIDRPPPAKNAMVERSHQTMYNQAIKGKRYGTWRGFFNNTEKRRKRLNESYPSRALGKKAPLAAFPEARHSGRRYTVGQEKRLLKTARVHDLLAGGKWHRKVSSNKCVRLGGQVYYVRGAGPGSMVTVTFCKESRKLVFRNVNELILEQRPIKGISKEGLMGGSQETLNSIKARFLKGRDFPL